VSDQTDSSGTVLVEHLRGDVRHLVRRLLRNWRLIGVGTAVGLPLSVLLLLAVRGFFNPAPGVGNIVFYKPTIDPFSLLAIAVFIAAVGTASGVPARPTSGQDESARRTPPRLTGASAPDAVRGRRGARVPDQ